MGALMIMPRQPRLVPVSHGFMLLSTSNGSQIQHSRRLRHLFRTKIKDQRSYLPICSGTSKDPIRPGNFLNPRRTVIDDSKLPRVVLLRLTTTCKTGSQGRCGRSISTVLVSPKAKSKPVFVFESVSILFFALHSAGFRRHLESPLRPITNLLGQHESIKAPVDIIAANLTFPGLFVTFPSTEQHQ